MQEPITLIEEVTQKLIQYTDQTIELYKLKAINKLADIVSILAEHFVLTLFICMILISLTIGVALWIGGMLSELFYGFFIVAGFYMLLFILLLIFRNKWIRKPLRNLIIDHELNKQV